MKSIYIHVGAGKTGTSALQEFFFLNRESLGAQGIYIPDVGRTNSKCSLFHHELAGGRNREIELEKTLDLWKEVAKLQHDKILVSSEIFHSRIKLPKNREFFVRIRELLSNRAIKIVFYIRREDQWLQSAYEQWVKAGTKRDGEKIEDFVVSVKSNLGKQVFLFAEVFGDKNVIVRPYERGQFYGGSIFFDFLNAIGASEIQNAIFPNRNSNPRLSRDALEFKRLVNTVCTRKRDADYIGRLLKGYSERVDKASQAVFRNANLIPLPMREKILEECAPLYEDIARRFLGREDGVLFYEKFDGEDCQYTFNVEDASKISGFIFIEMMKEIDGLRRRLKKIESDC